MTRGGSRAGAGRKAGTGDAAMRKMTLARVLGSIESGPDKTPLAFLLGVMQDSKAPLRDRIQCGVAAAPYVHPKLASIEIKGNAAAPLQVQSEIGIALKALAELARNRDEMVDITPSVLLEPASR